MLVIGQFVKKKRYPKSIYRLTLCISFPKRTIFETYMSTGISTSTTRLTLQENVFLNIKINVDTLQEYVCTYVSYRPLPLRSTYRVGFRNINMHAYCRTVVVKSAVAIFSHPNHFHDLNTCNYSILNNCNT